MKLTFRLTVAAIDDYKQNIVCEKNCDLTVGYVRAEVALVATEESQEFQHQLFDFQNKGLLKCCH